MEEALIAHLLADAGIIAAVGSRVTWAERSRGDGLPAIVLHRIGGPRDYTMDGPSGLVASRIQADCWADSYAAAKQSARAVRDVLAGVRHITRDGIALQGAFIDAERDLTETGSEAAERLHRISLDFTLWHSE